MKPLLEQYTTYNHWANSRIINTVMLHGMDILDVEIKSSFPSLRKTIYHIWDAEKAWLKRFEGEIDMGKVSFSNKFEGDAEHAFRDWLEVSAGHMSFVIDHDAEYLETILHYQNMKGEPFAGEFTGLIMHVMNHSTFHRGQIVTILRALGVTEIPSTDLVTYLRNPTKR